MKHFCYALSFVVIVLGSVEGVSSDWNKIVTCTNQNCVFADNQFSQADE